MEWDTEVASTNVIAEVLKQEGFDVTITPLDNAIMWESIANGESDAMVLLGSLIRMVLSMSSIKIRWIISV